MKKRTTEEFKKLVYDLVGDEYTVLGEYMTTLTKIQMRHNKCGTEFTPTPARFLEGTRCPKCRSSHQPKSEEKFISELPQGYTLVGDYVNSKTKVLIRHENCGYEWYTNPATIIRGHGCPKCANNSIGDRSRISSEEIENRLNNRNIKMLGDYVSRHTKTLFKCEVCGNEWETYPASIFSGKGCPKCAIKKVHDMQRKGQKDFEFEVFSKTDGNILPIGEYKSYHDKTIFKCMTCGHEWEAIPSNVISNGTGCPKCASLVSNKEKDLRAFIESLGVSPLYNVRDVIPPKELDIYIPEKNVAIEFNGNYWHGAEQKDKNYHYNKSKECEEKGVRLIHIFEYEWDNERQRPILENIIKHALGITEHEIYARKCTIEERPSASMREFFEANNIQGFRGGQKAVCLVYQGEVIMSYIVGKCFFHKQPSYEIIRGATKLGYTIVGGASKLWRYIINKWNDLPILYYIDYNYFNGSSMGSLEGLRFVKVTPSFKNYWVKHWKTGEENVIKNREPMYHKEVMRAQAEGMGWPIYNAGTKTYIYEPSHTE